MIVFPNAKINLGLRVIRKRQDGFHDIETVFYPIGLSDILEIIVKGQGASGGKIKFTTSGIHIDGNIDTNLCVKAYNLLDKKFNLPPLEIHLHKIIPIGAGLGGGSSDAAFMVKALNQQFKLGLDIPEMIDFASKLGSDCAFFINNAPAFATGRGNELHDIIFSLKNYHLVLVVPNIHISTREAYNQLVPYTGSNNLLENLKKPVSEWKHTIVNDFEKNIFYGHPEIADIKEKLYLNGALFASMSGSGSSVFGLFEEIPEIEGQFPECIVWNEKL